MEIDLELEILKQRYMIKFMECNRPFWLGGFNRKKYTGLREEYDNKLREYWLKKFEDIEVVNSDKL